MIRRALRFAKRSLRRASAPFSPRAVILLYHRVRETDRDPLLLSVHPSRFAAHMEHLRKNHSVLPLRELRRHLREGSLPHRGVAVTFDDGYADNLHQAKPILDRFEIPATVFVTSGPLGLEQEFWWDELARRLLPPQRRSVTLALKLGTGSIVHPLKGGVPATWNLSRGEDPDSDPRVFRVLLNLLRMTPEPERSRLLSEIRSQLHDEAPPRQDGRAMTPLELRSLAEGGRVEIGAHSVTHASFGCLTEEEQRREMRESRSALERILGKSVRFFAYPFGSFRDVTDRTHPLAAEEGFDAAFLNYAEPVTRRSDPYWLPRCFVRDWTETEFPRYLDDYFRS